MSAASVLAATTNQRCPSLTHDIRKFQARLLRLCWYQPWEFPRYRPLATLYRPSASDVSGLIYVCDLCLWRWCKCLSSLKCLTPLFLWWNLLLAWPSRTTQTWYVLFSLSTDVRRRRRRRRRFHIDLGPLWGSSVDLWAGECETQLS